jgi:hypothetical protein
MIPILEPAQYPSILFYSFLLMFVLGVPTTLLSLALFFMLERVPSCRAQDVIPLACTIVLLAITLLFFTGSQTPDSYQRIGIFVIVTSFLLNAMAILALLPFIRRHAGTFPPYPAIFIAGLVTFFLLAAFGLVGGETRVIPGDGAGQRLELVIRIVVMVVISALVYAGAARMGKRAVPGKEKRES